MAKRRKAGQGTLRLRKDGRWEGRVVVGYDDNGKPKTKNVTAKTKAECQKKLDSLRESCGVVSGKARPDMLFGDWLDLWYKTYSKPNIRVTTQLSYENRIYLHIIPSIGKIPLNKLMQSDLQKFYADLKKERTKIKGRAVRHRRVRPPGALLSRHLPHGAAKGIGGKTHQYKPGDWLQAAAEKSTGNAGADA